METFPLQAISKKVQPQGGGLRCAVHRRAATLQAGSAGGHHHHHNRHRQHQPESWDWEDAWERLPGNMKACVATIEVAALEAAMHHATATHRFCVDCKHNVVTALDLLVGRYAVGELENKEEYNAELFQPFAGRVVPLPTAGGDGGGGGAGAGDDGGGQQPLALPASAPATGEAEAEGEGEEGSSSSPPPPGAEGEGEGEGEGETGLALSLSSSPNSTATATGGRKVLACDVQDVEELITWHEDFDSQEYAASGQRHAATLEHGQREVRSLVGALLLSQLRGCWHAHTAQVQAEQVRQDRQTRERTGQRLQRSSGWCGVHLSCVFCP